MLDSEATRGDSGRSRDQPGRSCMRVRKRRAEEAQTSAPPRQKKRPRQSRAKFTVGIILEAAELLLQEGGLDAVTTRRVAHRAGVGIGTLYEYFPNRDAILIQLANRKMQRRRREAFPALLKLESDDHALPELFKVTVDDAIGMDRALLQLGREFHIRYARHFYFGAYYSQDTSRSRRKLIEDIEQRIIELLKRRTREVGEKDTALAAFLIVRAMRGMVDIVIEERPELLDSPAFSALLQRVQLAIVDYQPDAAPRPLAENSGITDLDD